MYFDIVMLAHVYTLDLLYGLQRWLADMVECQHYRYVWTLIAAMNGLIRYGLEYV